MPNATIEINDPKDITSEKELFIVEGFAQLKTSGEISKLYSEKFPGKPKLSRMLIQYYKTTRAGAIDKIREKFIAKMMYVPIANEKVRLKRTEDLYNAASEMVTTNNKRKLDAIDTSLRCLKEAREEVKGDYKTTQNFMQFNQYNELTNEQLFEKQKELEKKFIELKKEGDVYGQVKSA